MKENTPWCEKYRPQKMEDIVLDPKNRKIFDNILNNAKIPHLLFYGPPGVGKTTSAENLVNSYQRLYYKKNKETVIHLNASDERGIEVIRNQIHQFVKSNNMFESGYKFVILDEVDYMTKNAQQALKNLLQTCSNNVRFFLICNYICKIDDSLKNEFICIRFNQLPRKDINEFIFNIAKEEKIFLNDKILYNIQEMFSSDIRSMVNFLQLHYDEHFWKNFIDQHKLWERLHILFKENRKKEEIIDYVLEICKHSSIDIRTCIKKYFDYIIQNEPDYLSFSFLNIAENIIHISEVNTFILEYFINNISNHYNIKK